MTYGSVPADASASPPKLSEVEGVDMPGEAFMRTVFGLKQDGIGVAINTPQTVAYVVRGDQVRAGDGRPDGLVRARSAGYVPEHRPR